MKINCQIAGDLMAPYLDGSCSEDSKKALEEYIAGCEVCREKLRRMGGDTPDPTPGLEAVNLKAYAKKVKKHRITIATVTALLFLALAGALVLGVVNLTLKDMVDRNHRTIFSRPRTELLDPNADNTNYRWDPAEWEGVTDLTVGDVVTTAGKVRDFELFTNTTQIKVTVTGTDAVIRLHLFDDEDEVTLQSNEDSPGTSVVFTNMNSGFHYRVTVEAPADTPVTVTDGWEVTFPKSMRYVLHELFGLGEDPYGS